MKRQMNEELKKYVQNNIFQRYAKYYSHGMLHINNVINNMLNICSRINSKGKFNLWTNNPVLVQKRDEFQVKYLDKEYTKSIYKAQWKKMIEDGTMEKIKNYYEDY